MKTVKKTAEYTIYQKRNNRFAVKGADNAWVNGDEKVKILLSEDLVKVTAPSPKEEPATEEEAPEVADTEVADAEPAEADKE